MRGRRRRGAGQNGIAAAAAVVEPSGHGSALGSGDVLAAEDHGVEAGTSGPSLP